MKIVGREAPADIQIPIPGVSGLHLLVEPLGPQGYRIWDLGSTNGTFVNGERITETIVTPRDHLQLGSWVFDWVAYGSALSSIESSGRTLSIGRDQHNDVVIPDPRVSSRHAAAVIRGHLVMLADLGSSNGTLVDGRKITCTLLNSGSSVSLGSMPVNLMALLAARGSLGNAGQLFDQSEQSLPPQQSGLVKADTPDAPPESVSDEPEFDQTPDRRPLMIWGGVSAAVVVAVLAGLFFTGTIWPYWYRPYENPWPASVATVGDALDSIPGLEGRIEQSGASADSAAQQLEPLEVAIPVLNTIDGWRRQRASDELGMAISILGGLTGQNYPDNFYDLVIAALNYSAPGTGEYLRATEDFVRDALQAQDGLLAIGAGCRRVSAEVTAFRDNESKNQLLRLEQEVLGLRRQLENSRPELSSLQSRAGSVMTGATAVRVAINGAAGSSIGAYVRPQLYEVQAFVGRVVQPIELFEQELHSVINGVPTILAGLDEVPEIALQARASDGLQRKRHARGGPS